MTMMELTTQVNLLGDIAATAARYRSLDKVIEEFKEDPSFNPSMPHLGFVLAHALRVSAKAMLFELLDESEAKGDA